MIEPRHGQHRCSEHETSRGAQVVHHWSARSPTHVVLIAHGGGEHARRYDHVAEALVAHGAVVHAPDLHGHGLSDGERSLVDDVEALVTDLGAVARRAGDEHPGLPVVLVGHSLGGLVATRFAQRHEVDLAGLVLSAPGIAGNEALGALLETDPMPELSADSAGLSRDPAVGAAYDADPLVHHGPLLRGTLAGVYAGIAAVAAGPRLDVPTLWLHGDADPYALPDPTGAALEAIRPDDLEVHRYPGARHEVLNETNRDEVIADLVAFVARVT